MAELDSNGLFAIEVDADDYAETVAGDSPSSVDRTFQSEADFQKQKAGYSAKVDQGGLCDELVSLLPALASVDDGGDVQGGGGSGSLNLNKKHVQLLGYAVGEMYYDRRYEDVLALCRRVREVCDVGAVKGLRESLERWEGRCRARVEREEK